MPCYPLLLLIPILHRGYAIRQQTIDNIVHDALLLGPLQIVNVGCGMDPLYFRLRERQMCLAYFIDIDLNETASKKIHTIVSSPCLNAYLDNPQLDYSSSAFLRSDKYACIGTDITDGDALNACFSLLSPFFDPNSPTLFISECVLSYLAPDKADAFLSWLNAFMTGPALLVLYEQALQDDDDDHDSLDPFAVKMVQHFKMIQSPIVSAEERYRSIADQQKRFIHLGYTLASGALLSELWHDDNRTSELYSLEPFDEWEELDLKLQHYMVFFASNDPSYYSSILKRYVDQVKLAKLGQRYPKLEIPMVTMPMNGGLKRWGHASALVQSKVISFGGFGGANLGAMGMTCAYQRHADTFLLADNAISMANSKTHPCARIHCQLVPFGKDQVLLFGGRTSPMNALNDLWLGLLGSSNTVTWQQLQSHYSAVGPCPRYRHAMNSRILEDGEAAVVVSGGIDGKGNVLSDIWIYYRSQWTKVQVPDACCARFSHTIHLLQDKVLLVGGRTLYALVEHLISIFDVSSLACWNYRSSLRLPSRYGHTSHLLANDEYLLVAGGLSNRRRDLLRKGPAEYSSREKILIVRLSDLFCLNIITHNPSYAMIHHSSVYDHDREKLWIIGGGFTCFSMGSHFDPQPLCITLTDCLASLRKGVLCQQILTPDSRSLPHIPIYYEPKVIAPSCQTPFVMRGLHLGPLQREWTWQDLLHACPESLKVSIHVSQDPCLAFHDRNFQYHVTPFGSFIRNQLYGQDFGNYYYMRAVDGRQNVVRLEKNFPEIAAAFCLPSCIVPDLEKRVFSSILRLSSPNVQLWVHYDVMDNVLCQIWGTKRVILWPPSDLQHLSIKGSSTTLASGDIWTKIFAQDAGYQQSCPVICDLCPGDVLFIPALWFHHVTAGPAEPSLAVNVFWKGEEDQNLYDTKDIYGNKDLLPFQRASEKLTSLVKEMKRDLPGKYHSFYLTKLAQQLSIS